MNVAQKSGIILLASLVGWAFLLLGVYLLALVIDWMF